MTSVNQEFPGVMQEDPRVRTTLVKGGMNFHDVTETVCRPVETKPGKAWWILFMTALSFLGLLLVSVGYLFIEGTGIWGLNNPVAWGFPS